MSNYLREAFKELELLDEEVFPFDKDGAAELKNFMDGDITDDTESIIDPEAESEEDLQDSYEGKVVIQCKICGEKQYEDPEDIIIDENSDYVNVGEECPSCSSVDGYKIIGQIAPYCPDCAAKDDIDVDIDIDDNELEEALGGKNYIKESKTLGKSKIRKSSRKKLAESLNEKRETGLGDVVQQMLDGEFYDMVQSKKTGKMQSVGRKPLYNATDIGIDDDGLVIRVKDEAAAAPAKEVADKFGLKTAYEAPKKYQRDPRGFFHIYISEDEWDKDVSDIAFGKELKEYYDDELDVEIDRLHTLQAMRDRLRELQKELKSQLGIKSRGPRKNPYSEPDEPSIGIDFDMEFTEYGPATFYIYSEGPNDYWMEDDLGVDQESFSTVDEVIEFFRKVKDGTSGIYESTMSSKKRPIMKECGDSQKQMSESVENVTVETDTNIVTVTPEGSGDVTVQTQSKGEPDAGAEVIVPVDDETKDEIDMNDHNYDETDIEDIDIDDIDIDGFDELGESYMKKVYGNVESYKTTSSKFDNKKLMIEGVITFKSGKKAKTNFIFENIVKTRSGKVKFIGENLQLSNNKRAFTITTSVKDKKGICESFNYNYIAKDANTNKRVPLYGTIKK